MPPDESSRDTASKGALAGAILFVGLIVLFNIGGSSPAFRVALAVVAVAAHLVLFPVVATMRVPGWARPAGYTWLALDVILNMATLNGVPDATTMPLRLGGHVLAAAWIASTGSSVTAAPRAVGLLLAVLLAAQAFAAPWAPSWALYPPFVLVPVWLVLVWRWLRNSTEARAAA